MNISQQEYDELKERAIGNGLVIASLLAHLHNLGIINREIIEHTKKDSQFKANYYEKKGANLQIEDVFHGLSIAIEDKNTF